MLLTGKRDSRARRGNVVVMTAVLLTALFAMVAFAIDYGYIFHVRTELQRTADACALAAVQRLPDEPNAIAAAQLVAEENKASAGVDLSVGDVRFGTWDRDTATFTPGTFEPNAAEVTVERSAAKGNAVRLFFAPVLGTTETDVSATAIAIYDNNFCGPLVGIEWVSVPGGPRVDSYRSGEGSYYTQSARDNGSLCSDGPIGLAGNPLVSGDANAGRGHHTTLEGSSIVTGNTTPRLRPLNMPDVDASEYEYDNDNAGLPGIQKGNSLVSPLDANGNFLVDGKTTYDLPPGTYYFHNLTLTGQSTLRISGPTTIYLTGSVDTSGGRLINDTQIPSNFQLLMEGGANSTAIVTADADLYAVIYAPKTAVETRGSAAFHGVAVGKTLLVTGDGAIHYDEDLGLHDLDIPKRVALVK